MKSFILCALLAVSAVGHSQECTQTLAGEVRDRHTSEPVAFAKVQLVAANRQVLADSLGRFQFTNLCPGTITVRCIAHFGCEPVDVQLTLPLTEPFVFNVETHQVDLDETTVEAYRFRREAQARLQLDPKDLSVVRGATLGEQLERIPGVTSLSTGSSIVKPVINGMHSNRLVVVNNGVRQEGQQWGSEHAPEIDPNLAGNLEVIQGAAGLQYGPDAIGGVVIVSPDALGYGKSLNGWVKTAGNTNGRGGMLSGLVGGSLFKSGKIAYRFHGTGRINGTQSTPDYFIKNTAVKETSFSAAAGYKGTRLETDIFYSRFSTHLGIFTGSHIGNLTDLNAAFLADKPKDSGYFTYGIQNPKQFVEHQLTRFALNYAWNERVKTFFLFGYQYNLRQEYDTHKVYNDSIAALGLPSFELNLWTNTAELRTEIAHSKRYKSTIGLSGFQQDNAYSGRFFIPNFKKWQAGGYYIGKLETEKWQFELGARYDWSKLRAFLYQNDVLTTPERTFGHLSATLGASRIIGHHWIVKLHGGTAWRPPSINELYSNGLHHGAASIEVGDASLTKEVVYHVQAGAQYKSRLATLDVSAFFNHFDGYINLQPVLPPQLTIVGAFPVFHYRQSTVQLSGMNAQLEIPVLKWLKYTVQGSMLFANDLDNKVPVYGIPSNRLTNRLRAGANWKNTKWSWFAELEGLNVFRQNRVPANSDYVDPPAGYFLLNGALGIARKMPNEQSLQIVIGVSNLTNTVYRDYMNRFRYFTDDVGRNWNVKAIIPFSLKQKQTK